MRAAPWLVAVKMIVLAALVGAAEEDGGKLRQGFYEQSCPRAEQIVRHYVEQHVSHAPSVAATLLRTHFHDCFVRGCDGSVLLNGTNDGEAEKDAAPNLTLRGFAFLDRVKALVEQECPGVVSCADVLALAARDAIGAIGGPYWRVPTGRRDGRVSLKQEALDQVPAPTMNFTDLLTSFRSKGLKLPDLVWLSGDRQIASRNLGEKQRGYCRSKRAPPSPTDERDGEGRGGGGLPARGGVPRHPRPRPDGGRGGGAACGGGPTAEAAELVLKSAVCYSRPKSAVRFFCWARPCVQLTPYAWNLLVDVLGIREQSTRSDAGVCLDGEDGAVGTEELEQLVDPVPARQVSHEQLARPRLALRPAARILSALTLSRWLLLLPVRRRANAARPLLLVVRLRCSRATTQVLAQARKPLPPAVLRRPAPPGSLRGRSPNRSAW